MGSHQRLPRRGWPPAPRPGRRHPYHFRSQHPRSTVPASLRCRRPSSCPPPAHPRSALVETRPPHRSGDVENERDGGRHRAATPPGSASRRCRRPLPPLCLLLSNRCPLPLLPRRRFLGSIRRPPTASQPSPSTPYPFSHLEVPLRRRRPRLISAVSLGWCPPPCPFGFYPAGSAILAPPPGFRPPLLRTTIPPCRCPS